MSEYVIYHVEIAESLVFAGNGITLKWDTDTEEWVYDVTAGGQGVEQMRSSSEGAMAVFLDQSKRELLAQVMTALGETGRAIVTEWRSPAVQLDPMNGENRWIIQTRHAGPGAYDVVPEEIAERMGFPHWSWR